MKEKPKAALVISMGKKDGEAGDDKSYFSAPEGMDMEGKKPGDMIEFVGEARIEEDGKLCLKKMNGMDVPGAGEPEKMGDGEKDAYKGGFADAVMPPKEDDLDEGAA